mmetsp:Transcript_15175/g.51249  ORF Transcript_15175/g.51249 Transcript_15175/m.51249 type:complete len:226 (+) Transcript_15175:699-1376(+)
MARHEHTERELRSWFEVPPPKMPPMARRVAPRARRASSTRPRALSPESGDSSVTWALGSATLYTEVEPQRTADGARDRYAPWKATAASRSTMGKVTTTALSVDGSGRLAQVRRSSRTNAVRGDTAPRSTGWKYGALSPQAFGSRQVTDTSLPEWCRWRASREPSQPPPRTSTGPSRGAPARAAGAALGATLAAAFTGCCMHGAGRVAKPATLCTPRTSMRRRKGH